MRRRKMQPHASFKTSNLCQLNYHFDPVNGILTSVKSCQVIYFFFFYMAPFNNLSPPPSPYFYLSKKKHQLKTFLTFFTFYITLIIFYYYLNKKIHYKTKNFYFFIWILSTLYHINHFYSHSKKNSPMKKG